MTERPIVLSLCDRSGVMVQPWLDAGYECWIVDVQHPPGRHRHGHLMRVGCDVRGFNFEALPARVITFAFPPCTNLAVSGARWFTDKGLESLHESLGLVVACKWICEASSAPWMLENPISTLSSYWRKPDYQFQPWHYGTPESKKTCLWTGNGFVMPPREVMEPPAGLKQSVWKMPPSANRGDLRSVTCDSFARAVFHANSPQRDRSQADGRTGCHADSDGDCSWLGCPQSNPSTRQMYCPLADDCEEPSL